MEDASADATAQQAPDGVQVERDQQQAQGSDEPWVNKAEVIEYHKRTREAERQIRELKETIASLQSRPKANASKPADAGSDRLEALEKRLLIRDAIDDAGVKLSRRQREIVETLFNSSQPTDISSWLRDTVAVFQPSNPAPTDPPKADSPPAAQGADAQAHPFKQPPVTNTGAPGAPQVLSDDFFEIPADLWKSLPPEERLKRMKAYTKKGRR